MVILFVLREHIGWLNGSWSGSGLALESSQGFTKSYMESETCWKTSTCINQWKNNSTSLRTVHEWKGFHNLSISGAKSFSSLHSAMPALPEKITRFFRRWIWFQTTSLQPNGIHSDVFALPYLEVKICRYPLVNQHNYGKSPFFYGKTHYKWQFSIAMLVYQRVKICRYLCVLSGLNGSTYGYWHVLTSCEIWSMPKKIMQK